MQVKYLSQCLALSGYLANDNLLYHHHYPHYHHQLISSKKVCLSRLALVLKEVSFLGGLPTQEALLPGCSDLGDGTSQKQAGGQNDLSPASILRIS